MVCFEFFWVAHFLLFSQIIVVRSNEDTSIISVFQLLNHAHLEWKDYISIHFPLLLFEFLFIVVSAHQ